MHNSIKKNKYIEEENGKCTVFSGFPEFGYELIATLPFCYNLHKQGLLGKTISGVDTKCFYFFSPEHIEVNEKRSFENVKLLIKEEFPNINIHQNRLDWEKFTPPPLKEQYKKDAIVFNKPTVILTNRINMEWGRDPINYLSNEYIIEIANILSPLYQVVLIQSSDFSSLYEDHAPFTPFELFGLSEDTCKQHGIITLGMLHKKYNTISLNELQCRLYSGSEKFISSNGGLGILASYFGGENIIFSKMCHELDPDVNSFNTWYYRFSNCIIKVVNTERELIDLIKSKWVCKDVLFNVLIRTCGRPNYFHDCITSILDQNYQNYRIIVGVDDEKSMEYVRKHSCAIVELEKDGNRKQHAPVNDGSYGDWFPFNTYFNTLQKYVNSGYIIYLDDDDALSGNQVLSELNGIIQKTDSDLIFWRVQFPDRLVPSDANWALKKPVCRDISTIGFCFQASLKPFWEPWKRGDFRAARWLSQNSAKQLWQNDIFTMLQREKENGKGRRDDKKMLCIPSIPPLSIVMTAYNASSYLAQSLDSVFQNINELPNVQTSVLLGIDACPRTLDVARSLSRIYGHNLSVWYSKENCGTYLLKNSLLKKIARRDSLVLFFDSDDLMPPGFISSYYDFFCGQMRSQKNRYNHIILQTFSIGVPDFCLEQSETINEGNVDIFANVHALIRQGNGIQAVPYLLHLLKKRQSGTRIPYLIHSLVRLNFIKENNKSGFSEIQYTHKISHNAIISSHNTIAQLGYYHPYRVGQDTDLLERAKLSGIRRLSDKVLLPCYIRRVSQNSLTKCSEFGFESQYRKNAREENAKLIASGILTAEGETVKLYKIL